MKLPVTRVDNLTEIWPIIRDGLYVVKEESGADWEPHDVFRLIKNGEWHILMLGETFFTIFSVGKNCFTGERFILIEASYAPGTNAIVDMFDDLYGQLAKDLNCSYFETVSRRKGLTRVGWELQDMTFRRRVR